MLSSISHFVTHLDNFSHFPTINFNRKKKISTFPGGLYSIFFTAFVWWQWYQQLTLMVTYKGGTVNQIEHAAEFENIGKVNFNDSGSLPFYYVHYKGHLMHKTSSQCTETAGDCEKLVRKYLDIGWQNHREEIGDEKLSTNISFQICTEQQLGPTFF